MIHVSGNGTIAGPTGGASRTRALILEGRTVGTVVDMISSNVAAPSERCRADVGAPVDRLVGRPLLVEA